MGVHLDFAGAQPGRFGDRPLAGIHIDAGQVGTAPRWAKTCRGHRSSPGSHQSQETAGLKGSNVPDGLFFQIQAWSAKKAGISNRFGNPTGMNS